MSNIKPAVPRETNRVKLEEKIPLQTPCSLFIDPCNLCNFSCKFCPTADKALLKKVGRPSCMMDYDLFCKIIKDVSEFGEKIKKIHLYLYGEPLLNDKFGKMIKYIKQKDVAQEVWSCTNASLLNREKALELIDAGLDLIKISVEAVSDEGYRRISNVRYSYDQIRENVRYFYSHKKQCKVQVKIIDCGLGKAEKEKFFNDFSQISDYINVENLMGWSAENLKDFTLGKKPDFSLEGFKFKYRDVCPLPFFTLAINSNGAVTICCVDWARYTVVGNVKTQSLKEIWESDRLYNFRMMQLSGDRKRNKACGYCNYLNGLPDDIDVSREKIMERLHEAHAR